MFKSVICRIGSLEIAPVGHTTYQAVTCRIGSLENIDDTSPADSTVICRVGSLEILRQRNADVKLLSMALANWAVVLLCAPIYF